MVVVEVCSTMKYPKRSQYKHAKQKKYHVRNWAEYNEGLRRRGDLTVWFDEEAIANWKADKTGKPGGQRVYSDGCNSHTDTDHRQLRIGTTLSRAVTSAL